MRRGRVGILNPLRRGAICGHLSCRAEPPRRRAMSGPEVMFPEEQQQISLVCARLHRDANAKAVLLIGRDGQPIAEAGDVDELDVTSLSSLTAGNVAATG